MPTVINRKCLIHSRKWRGNALLVLSDRGISYSRLKNDSPRVMNRKRLTNIKRLRHEEVAQGSGNAKENDVAGVTEA